MINFLYFVGIEFKLQWSCPISIGIRLVAEYYGATTFREDSIKQLDGIKDLGYFHEGQNKILQSIQDGKLHYETQLINQDDLCSVCAKKTKANGMMKSKFHVVFTDYEVKIQRRRWKGGYRNLQSGYQNLVKPGKKDWKRSTNNNIKKWLKQRLWSECLSIRMYITIISD